MNYLEEGLSREHQAGIHVVGEILGGRRTMKARRRSRSSIRGEENQDEEEHQEHDDEKEEKEE
eukprot:2057081-Pyramimonas_sp.AAC.1